MRGTIGLDRSSRDHKTLPFRDNNASHIALFLSICRKSMLRQHVAADATFTIP